MKNIATNTAAHVTFDQLPFESKSLLVVAVSFGYMSFGNIYPQPQAVLVASAQDFWNQAKHATSELGDLIRLSDAVCEWLKASHRQSA